MPKRKNRPKPRRPPVTRALPRAPQYSKPAPPPLTAAEVMQTLNNQKPGSPAEIVGQGITGQKPCDDTRQAQAQAMLAAIQSAGNEMLAKAQAIVAELASLTAQVPAASASCYCYPCTPNCTQLNYINNRMADLEQQSLDLLPKAQALAAQAMSLQALAQQPAPICGGSAPLGLPPGMNTQALADKFGITIPGSGASFGGMMGDNLLSGEAYQQALELAGMDGEEAGWAMDGRGAALKQFGKQLAAYQGKAGAAAALGGKVQDAKKKMEELEESRKDSPSAEAEYEYAKINYKELGPKYAALAQERGEQARGMANDALQSSMPSLPTPKSDEKPLIETAKELAKAGADIVVEEAKSKIGEEIEDSAKKMMGSLIGEQRTEALWGIKDITQAAAENVKFDQTWKDAINEIASASTSTEATERLIAQLDAGLGNVGEKAQEAYKKVFGGQ